MTNTNTNIDLLNLLHETHEQMMMMTSWLELLQPVKLEDNNKLSVITDIEELPSATLFKLDKEIFQEDQTSRSILKDLRKVIKHLEQQ